MTQTHPGVQKLADDWRSAGLRPGDTVLVHSSIARTIRRLKQHLPDAGPVHVLDSLLVAVQPGTLLLPLFNFDFTRGVAFDMRNTPSQMGALTEAARTHPGAVRTGHPIYGFAAIGVHAARLEGLKNSSGYGADSPFAMLRELDGKIAVLDLPDQNSMTFYHHVEESLGVDYRYHKAFTGQYTDEHGATSEATFSLFVRDLDRNVETHVDPMGELLWNQGLYTGDRPREGHGLRVIRARAMFEAVSDIIRSGRAEGLLFRYGRT
ncbi:MAG: AAC(3) family N-acetyltransferase [Planctomycetota bacterium]|nr:AAC(3) family N-acetyltransferase [Planctomycetota bacterium]